MSKKKVKRVKAGTSKVETAKRKALFVEAYITNGGNGREAAIAAGYKPGRAADKAAERMSHDVAVRKEIEARRSQVVAKAQVMTGVTVERTLLEVSRLAYSDPRKFYDADGNLIPIHKLDDDTAACIASLEVDEIGVEGVVVGRTKKIKHWDKNAALEKAMKYHGLYEKDNNQNAPRTVNLHAVTVTLDFDKVMERAARALRHNG